MSSEVSFRFTMKFKASESIRDNIAQRVKAPDQLSKRIGKDPLGRFREWWGVRHDFCFMTWLLVDIAMIEKKNRKMHG